MHTNNIPRESIVEVHIVEHSHPEEHIDQDIQLIYILQGSLTVHLENTAYKLFPEDIILINSGLRHRISSLDENLSVCFSISLQQLQNYLNQDIVLFSCNTVQMPKKDFSALKEIMHRILNNYVGEKQFRDIYLNSQYHALVYELCTDYLVADQSYTIYKNHSDSEYRIQIILSYIHSDFRQAITLAELADKLFMSNAYLSKYIKKHLGMSFLEYLNRVRLNHAVYDLLHHENSIMKIALDNGFASAQAFTKQFKEIYQELPSTYKARHKTASLDETAQEDLIYTKIKGFLLQRDGELNGLLEAEQTSPIGVNVLEYVPLIKNWNRLINIGAAADLLNVDTQNHVLYLKKTLGFTHVRIWDVFLKVCTYRRIRIPSSIRSQSLIRFLTSCWGLISSLIWILALNHIGCLKIPA